MPALVAGIHVFLAVRRQKQDVDGRDEPGHDEVERPQPMMFDYFAGA
jgi:hypothetical protein